MNAQVSIQRGKVFVYRAFDVASEIDLLQLERVLAQRGKDSRVRLEKSKRTAIVIRNAPLRLHLGEAEFDLDGFGTLKCEVSATLYDYGSLTIILALPIAPQTPFETLVRLSDAINRCGTGPKEIDGLARAKCRELIRSTPLAFKNASEWEPYEDYTIFFLEEVTGASSGRELLNRADIPALILGEPRLKLSERNRSDILDSAMQYADDDLVIIDWNSALLYEPTGSLEIADVLEFALTQLLEVRFYDDLIDRRLSELYDAAEVKRSRIIAGRYSQLAHEANTRYLEISELMARVDNSVKPVGDFYLSSVYRMAIAQFRIQEWQASISSKMDSLKRVSELLLGESNVRRSHVLEIIIVLLILYEIVAPLLLKK